MLVQQAHGIWALVEQTTPDICWTNASLLGQQSSRSRCLFNKRLNHRRLLNKCPITFPWKIWRVAFSNPSNVIFDLEMVGDAMKIATHVIQTHFINLGPDKVSTCKWFCIEICLNFALMLLPFSFEISTPKLIYCRRKYLVLSLVSTNKLINSRLVWY